MDAAELQISSFYSHIFLAQSWRLHYPQCNLTMDSSVQVDSGGLC